MAKLRYAHADADHQRLHGKECRVCMLIVERDALARVADAVRGLHIKPLGKGRVEFETPTAALIEIARALSSLSASEQEEKTDAD